MTAIMQGDPEIKIQFSHYKWRTRNSSTGQNLSHLSYNNNKKPPKSSLNLVFLSTLQNEIFGEPCNERFTFSSRKTDIRVRPNKNNNIFNISNNNK